MKSFLNNINELIGEYRPEEFYSIYARPSSGKSLYLLEESANLISQGAKILYLNTETGFSGLFDMWKEKIEQKFGIKFTESNFVVFNIASIIELMKLLAMPIVIEVGKGGKETVYLDSVNKITKDVDTLYKHVHYKNNPVVILDSFSTLIRESFTTAVENFSGRADATGLVFAAFRRFMNKTGSFVFMTHHASVDPINMFHSKDKMRGGFVIAYYSKYILYYEQQAKNTMKDFRRIWGVRVSGKKGLVGVSLG